MRVYYDTSKTITRDPLKRKWLSMIRRCTDKKAVRYSCYGGRGITICKRWHDFKNFRDDLQRTYIEHVEKFGAKETSIDRIDNNKGYSKANCRWATLTEQNRNCSRNTIIEFRNRKMLLVEWAELFNTTSRSINVRLKRGWSLERALLEYSSKKRGARREVRSY